MSILSIFKRKEQQQPVPHFDMNDPETPITHYTYPPKKLTGYIFKKKV